MADTNRFLRFLDRLRGSGELSEADVEEISHLPEEPVRVRQERDINWNISRPMTPDEYIRTCNVSTFSTKEEGVESFGWRMFPTGSGPKIKPGEYGVLSGSV